MGKGVIWTKVLIMLVVSLAIVSIVRWWLKDMFTQETAIADIGATNYKMINTIKMVEVYMEQYLDFAAIKVARDVTGEYDPDWDSIFSDSSLIDDFKRELEKELIPSYRARFDTTITVENLEVSDKKIILDYNVLVEHEYRTLEKDEQIILEL
jgi:hypothetical protein